MRAATTLTLLALFALPVNADDCEPGPTGPAAVEAPADPAPALEDARKELGIARREFKRLTRFEREALKDAREVTAATQRGRALAPAFAEAATLLERAAANNAGNASILEDMAESYRAMARELDRKAAPPLTEPAETLLTEAAKEKQDERTADSWDLVKRGDPRYRALACNMKALTGAFAALGDTQDGAVASAASLHKALQPWFEGVETERPEPEAEPICTSGGG